jgi:hypothetical protein
VRAAVSKSIAVVSGKTKSAILSANAKLTVKISILKFYRKKLMKSRNKFNSALSQL